MVNYSLNATFQALGDITRRGILASLEGGPLTAGEIAAPLSMSKPAVSKHLKVLEQAGLIHRKIEGRRHLIHLRADPLRQASAWITHYQVFWTDVLDRMENFLNENPRN